MHALVVVFVFFFFLFFFCPLFFLFRFLFVCSDHRAKKRGDGGDDGMKLDSINRNANLDKYAVGQAVSIDDVRNMVGVRRRAATVARAEMNPGTATLRCLLLFLCFSPHSASFSN